LGQNILYETGTIAALARYLDALRTGFAKKADDQHQIMDDLITKYSALPTYEGKPGHRKDEEVVVSCMPR
jgi:hypothetical protein